MIIEKLYASKKTVFSIRDLRYFFTKMSDQEIRNFFYRSVKSGAMLPVAPGLYSLVWRTFDPFEAAWKIRLKSYVSLETVLSKEGMIFQYYGNTVFSASDNSIAKSASGWNFEYRKMKDSVLTNPSGVVSTPTYRIATRERAFLDRLYLTPWYFFDNISLLDWEKVDSILPIYGNRRLEKEVTRLRKEHA